ncbi:unnamed protein product [Didymodactylos carnosus]|uniref:Hexosyltransferase n=1 Tax=Didymodactylos carnosus TaxID=1234261 RepID=A0A814NIJ7_9BILA|nr:unnamed protein product [Didymodactylos carnosus]CAF1094166.1 unnamed protein product [Didymodactylos carnosus]CAF3565557.1 unnamed protein product [Didymodactylos carnosus]CAF3859527.1 unnamed protein product [Didymodactylos carnosus]
MSYDNENDKFLSFTRKKCFIGILLLNGILGIMYYFRAQSITIKTPTNIVSFYEENIPTSLKTLRNIFKNDYIQNDLTSFYSTVHRELQLGFRCLRTNTSLLTQRMKRSKNLYQYEVNNSIACIHNKTIDLLIMIISKSDNYKVRDAIRRTWGNIGYLHSKTPFITIKLLFIIDLDENYIRNIYLENELFNDIIQVQLPPRYTLVTYRVMSILDWSARFCRQAKYIFKTDDDIFINSPLLIRYVLNLISTSISNITNSTSNIKQLKHFNPNSFDLYGYKHSNPGVFRHSDDLVSQRYVITDDEYPCSRYPDFLSGFGYLIPSVVRDALIYAFYYDDHPFRISDVYITGILPDYLDIRRTPMSNYNIRYSGSCDQFFDNYKQSFACASGEHHGDNTDVFILYNKYWKILKGNIQAIYA